MQKSRHTFIILDLSPARFIARSSSALNIQELTSSMRKDTPEVKNLVRRDRFAPLLRPTYSISKYLLIQIDCSVRFCLNLELRCVIRYRIIPRLSLQHPSTAGFPAVRPRARTHSTSFRVRVDERFVDRVVRGDVSRRYRISKRSAHAGSRRWIEGAVGHFHHHRRRQVRPRIVGGGRLAQW